jgi:hypothetical protein
VLYRVKQLEVFGGMHSTRPSIFSLLQWVSFWQNRVLVERRFAVKQTRFNVEQIGSVKAGRSQGAARGVDPAGGHFSQRSRSPVGQMIFVTSNISS